MTFKVALVGLGNVGYKYDRDYKNVSYLTHYSTIKNLKGFKLILALDNNEENIKEFKRHSNVNVINIDRISEVDIKVDIVVIATPAKSHLDTINKVIKLKPRLIFCEKPLSISLKETKDIFETCKANSVILRVNFFRRFEKSSLEIKKFLKDIPFFRATVFYSNGLINNGSHFIDLVSYWFGKPKSIHLKKQHRTLKKSYLDFDMDFELSYDKGDIHFFSWQEEFYSNYSIRIYTDYFRIDYDINGYSTSISKKINDPDYEGFKRLEKIPKKIKNNLIDGFKPIYLKIYSDIVNSNTNNIQKDQVVPEIVDKLIKQI